MVHRYSWYNTKDSKWQVGDKQELNSLRMSGIECIHVQSKHCITKQSTIDFEQSILDKNTDIINDTPFGQDSDPYGY